MSSPACLLTEMARERSFENRVLRLARSAIICALFRSCTKYASPAHCKQSNASAAILGLPPLTPRSSRISLTIDSHEDLEIINLLAVAISCSLRRFELPRRVEQRCHRATMPAAATAASTGKSHSCRGACFPLSRNRTDLATLCTFLISFSM